MDSCSTIVVAILVGGLLEEKRVLLFSKDDDVTA